MTRLSWHISRLNRVIDGPLLARRASLTLLILGAAYVASHVVASAVVK